MPKQEHALPFCLCFSFNFQYIFQCRMNGQQVSEDENLSDKNESILQKVHAQKSLSSMSSYDSDTDIINRMPIMTTQYEKMHYPKKEDEESIELLQRTAGEVLSDPTLKINNGNQDDGDHLECVDGILPSPNKDEQQIPPGGIGGANGEGQDEVDAWPTREGRKMSKDSQTTTKISPAESSNAVTETIPEQGENLEKLCCRTLLGLLAWKTIFTKFSAVDLFFAAVSMSFYVFDLVTDILNAYSYYYFRDEHKDNLLYFGLTAVLIIVPSIIAQAFSLWWEAEDETQIRLHRQEEGRNEKHSFCYLFGIALMHVFQIAPLFRYVRAAYFGVRSRIEEQKGNNEKEIFYDKKWKYEYCDVSFLRLFDSFLESAPQLVLQLYIMVTTMQTPFITVISCLGSWGGLSMAFLSFQRALRNSQADKQQISIPGSIFLVLYRSCTILSRVFALALLLNVHIWAWLGLFIFHWSLMTAWIVYQGTNFCQSKAKELVYDVVIGFCYNFAYINVTNKTNNKCRMILFYMVMFVENCILAVVWLYFRQGGGNLIDTFIGSQSLVNSSPSTLEEETLPADVALAIVVLIPSMFILGILFMLLYYIFLHPTTGESSCCGSSNGRLTPKESDAEQTVELTTVELRATSESHRSYRRSEAIRSWHMDTQPLDYPKDTRPKRPNSEIIESSASSLFDEPTLAPTKPKPKPVEVNSAYCSCYSLRHEAEVVNTYQKEKSSQLVVSSASQIQEKTEVVYTPRKGNVVNIKDAELKALKVDLQLQEKKRKKLKIEQELRKLNLQPHTSSQSVSPQSPTEELFNRKGRVKDLLSPSTSMTLPKTPSRQLHVSSPVSMPVSDQPPPVVKEMPSKWVHPPSPLTQTFELKQTFTSQTMSHASPSSRTISMHRRRLNSEDANMEASSAMNYSPMSTKCGTFPRCSRRQELSTPNRSLQGKTLKTIRENKLAMHNAGGRDYSASLSNIAIKHQIGAGLKKAKVPRAMSFTVSKNEQVISIESAL
uniref:XK-related protein n=1 Tax=Phallusia mammillata TaxID=59560 RepID=A0A6F9DXC6_9ASCI|nr:XK-related a [Phallusia mammillata]